MSLYDISTNCNLTKAQSGLINEILLSQKVVPYFQNPEYYEVFAKKVLNSLSEYVYGAKEWEYTNYDNLRLEVTKGIQTYEIKPKLSRSSLELHLNKIFLNHIDSLKKILSSFKIDESYKDLSDQKSYLLENLNNLQNQYDNSIRLIEEYTTSSLMNDSTNSLEGTEGVEEYDLPLRSVNDYVYNHTDGNDTIHHTNITDVNGNLNEFLPKEHCKGSETETASVDYFTISIVLGVFGLIIFVLSIFGYNVMKKRRSRRKKDTEAGNELLQSLNK